MTDDRPLFATLKPVITCSIQQVTFVFDITKSKWIEVIFFQMFSLKSVFFPSIYSYHHFNFKMAFTTKIAYVLNAARGVGQRG